MLWAACSTSVDDGLLGVVTSTISTSIWAAFAIAGDEEKSIKSSHVPFELSLRGGGRAYRNDSNVSRDALSGTAFGMDLLSCLFLYVCLRLVGRHPMILSWVK